MKNCILVWILAGMSDRRADAEVSWRKCARSPENRGTFIEVWSWEVNIGKDDENGAILRK